jgi:TM2 domain-containing membrane protein YozV
MKRLHLLIAGLILISFSLHGQYRELKSRYEAQVKSYSFQKGDPYNPSSAGAASFFIPGLGQMMSGETGRGLCFLGGFTAVLVTCFAVSYSYVDKPEYESAPGAYFAMAGIIGALSIDLWSVSDAVKVAKIKNLALRDRKKTSVDLNITSFLDTSNTILAHKPALGISLKITF